VAHEMRLQHIFDAPPEVVFDALIDPEHHEELYVPEGWRLVESRMDLRVGGEWTLVVEGEDDERFSIKYVFTEIDRPHRLRFEMSMTVAGQTIDSVLDITFGDQSGRTLFTLVQGGFKTKEERDSFESGAPGFLERFQAVVTTRSARPSVPGNTPDGIARRIIRTNLYMVLATADEQGRPWASPVYYAPHKYAEFLWVSSPAATHSRNISVRPELGIVIFDSSVRIGTGQGVYMSASAEMVEGPDVAQAIDVYSRRAIEHGGVAWTSDDVREGGPIRLYRATAHEYSVLAKDGRPDHRITANVGRADGV
jgi:uncharacterized protein YndB with AHSA1/START domain/uncharacterized protein YhbP (UPF0306 family)